MRAPVVLFRPDGSIKSVTFARPSNMHAHFRWDGMIDAVTPANIRHHKYVLAMPNNGPDVIVVDGKELRLILTLAGANRVYHRIIDLKHQHGIHTFSRPLLTMYLSPQITPKVVEAIALSGTVVAIKSYPGHGGTTNSGAGMPFDECDDVIRAMTEWKVPLLVHAEDTHDTNGRELPHADREAHCIEHRLRRFREKHPDLFMTVEHASTIVACNLVDSDPSGRTRATFTPQHLWFTADDFAKVTWRNHLRCMPYVKTEADRLHLVSRAVSGDERYAAGDDTAPHPEKLKIGDFESAMCGCWLPHGIALYAVAFMREHALDMRFSKFMSYNGPAWYGLEPPDDDDTITIVAESQHDIPDPTPLPELQDRIIPLGWTTEPDRLKVGYVTALSNH